MCKRKQKSKKPKQLTIDTPDFRPMYLYGRSSLCKEVLQLNNKYKK